MKKPALKRFLCLFASLVLTWSLLPRLTAFAADSLATMPRENVRVGFFAFEGYHVTEEDGSRSGYGYEFLQLLAQYANWQYEYIG